jgi:mRNA interferase MazF
MGISRPGEVVIISFPFSDLSKRKLRPALVLALSDFDNLIVAQISSKLPEGSSGVVINNKDFVSGTPLKQKSYVRHSKIFTADPRLVVGSLGNISKGKKIEIHNKTNDLFKGLIE